MMGKWTMQSDRIDWPAFLTGEILVAGLLSKALYNIPTREWLNVLVSDGVFNESPLGNEQPEIQRGLALLQQWAAAASDV